MDKEERKVSIKLERHRWPDEIAKAKRKRRIQIGTVFALVFTFFMGWQSNNFLKGTSAGTSSSELNRFNRVYQDVLDYWFFADQYENPEKEILDNAIKGMLELNGDQHTNYLTAQESNDLASSIDRDFVGIGVQYLGGNSNMITRVFKESPAEKAGIIAGDIIYKVDGHLIDGKDSDQIRDLIVGKEGSQVNVEIKRGDQMKSFDIERQQINALAWGETLEEGVGYLEISSFGNNLGEAIKVYLDDMQANGVDRLIIDLRDNGGGYLHAIQEIAPIFFDNNDVVYQESFRTKKPKVYNVNQSEKANYDFKNIVLLVNENSASASEVLAIAMRENLETQIIGVNTYGKGTVQIQKKYTDGSALKVTLAKWLSPHGDSIDKTGIKPDFEVKLADIFYTEFIDLNDRVVKYDSVDEAVIYVQKALSYLGYHDGRSDGYYDAKTKAALKTYQGNEGYHQTSDITQETLLNLYSSVVSDWSMNKKDKDSQLHKAIEVVKRGS
ncbi:S41 family peptidase [Erysipelothrix urinaevulpis]|uniref:S41 family peptidase n=1 Tax=Erysipelothrix urinaevulpis TaxID=2683717 RepID=UPI001358E24C|nr:S41 family peptidase [Erysipelothrix urinaevulpis]